MLEKNLISSLKDADGRRWQGIPSIARTSKGTLYVAWGSGGTVEPEPENNIIVSRSFDDGKTWSRPELFIDPFGEERAYDVCFWMAPDGVLWCLYNVSDRKKQIYEIRAITCGNPDEQYPRWSHPRVIDFGAPFSFRSLKPIVLSSGEWVMPVTWSFRKEDFSPFDAENSSAQKLESYVKFSSYFPFSKQLEGAAISKDKGINWELYGAVKLPPWSLESCIFERKDGTLVMLSRSEAGCLWRSISPDKGQNWGIPERTNIINPSCRYDIQRLKSGKLLLINEFDPAKRVNLRAALSTDEGESFSEGLFIDGRYGSTRDAGVSYPQFTEGENGKIYMVYDYERQGAGEIIFASFNEKDVE